MRGIALRASLVQTRWSTLITFFTKYLTSRAARIRPRSPVHPARPTASTGIGAARIDVRRRVLMLSGTVAKPNTLSPNIRLPVASSRLEHRNPSGWREEDACCPRPAHAE
ncbi:MAG: hypothetical protein WBY93_07285 [Candidatus Binatus sp.]